MSPLDTPLYKYFIHSHRHCQWLYSTMNSFMASSAYTSVASSRASSLQSLLRHGVLPSVNFLRVESQGLTMTRRNNLREGGGYAGILSDYWARQDREWGMQAAGQFPFSITSSRIPARESRSGPAFPTQLKELISYCIPKGPSPTGFRSCNWGERLYR